MVLDELDRPFRLTLAVMVFVLAAVVSGFTVALIMGASLVEMALGLMTPCMMAFVVTLAARRRSHRLTRRVHRPSLT